MVQFVTQRERSYVIFVLASRPHARSCLACLYSRSPVKNLETLNCVSVWFVGYRMPHDTNEIKKTLGYWSLLSSGVWSPLSGTIVLTLQNSFCLHNQTDISVRFCQTTYHHIPEHISFLIHLRENVKSEVFKANSSAMVFIKAGRVISHVIFCRSCSSVHLLFQRFWGLVPVSFSKRSTRVLMNFCQVLYSSILIVEGACGGAVGWWTTLQAGRALVRFPMGSLDCSLT
jgi:hypothetical protein